MECVINFGSIYRNKARFKRITGMTKVVNTKKVYMHWINEKIPKVIKELLHVAR